MRTNKEERYIPVPRLSDTRYIPRLSDTRYSVRYPLLTYRDKRKTEICKQQSENAPPTRNLNKWFCGAVDRFKRYGEIEMRHLPAFRVGVANSFLD